MANLLPCPIAGESEISVLFQIFQKLWLDFCVGSAPQNLGSGPRNWGAVPRIQWRLFLYHVQYTKCSFFTPCLFSPFYYTRYSIPRSLFFRQVFFFSLIIPGTVYQIHFFSPSLFYLCCYYTAFLSLCLHQAYTRYRAQQLQQCGYSWASQFLRSPTLFLSVCPS